MYFPLPTHQLLGTQQASTELSAMREALAEALPDPHMLDGVSAVVLFAGAVALLAVAVVRMVPAWVRRMDAGTDARKRRAESRQDRTDRQDSDPQAFAIVIRNNESIREWIDDRAEQKARGVVQADVMPALARLEARLTSAFEAIERLATAQREHLDENKPYIKAIYQQEERHVMNAKRLDKVEGMNERVLDLLARISAKVEA